MEKIAVLGAGNGGLACSADLSLRGYKVNLFEHPRFADDIKTLRERGGIELTGVIGSGFVRLNKITTDIREAIEDVSIVFIVVPAFAHKTFIDLCLPHLKKGQVVVFMGKGGGSLEFARVLRERKVKKDILFGETSTLPYTARKTGPNQVKIFATVKKLPLAAFPAKKTSELVDIMCKMYPVTPVTNVIETLLLDLNMVVHPAPVILNAARIESKHEFCLYAEGVTPAVARVIEAVDKERLLVMESLGLKPIAFMELVCMIGLAAGKCNTILEDFVSPQGIIGARELKAPSTLNSRYITEDVPYGLVPLASIAEMLGVNTPAVEALITLASLLNQVDYWKEGRTVEKLGISGLNVEELKSYLDNGSR